MSHLKVELRSLKRRSLPNGYAFDLTRHCNGCWVKFGRITNRGRKCPECKRKVCKSCRVGLCDAAKWVCLACCAKRYSRQSSSNRIHWLQKRRSLYSSRIVSYLPQGVEPGKDGRSVPFGMLENDTKLVSTTSHGNCTSPVIDTVTPDAKTKDFLQSSGTAMPMNSSMSLGEQERPSEDPKRENRLDCERNGIRNAPLRPIEMSPLLKNRRESNDQNTRSRVIKNSKNDQPLCCESWRFLRNDPFGRLSVRDGPCISTSKARNALIFRRFMYGNAGEFAPYGKRSVSLPEGIVDVDPDTEGFHQDFVEFRVKKLEEDLAKDMLKDYWYYEDIDLHSLCALDLELRVPDKDDYRLVYLSSSQTSTDSNTDSLETAISVSRSTEYRSFLKKFKLHGVSVDSGEWNFSWLSSESEGESLTENEESLNSSCPSVILGPSEFNEDGRPDAICTESGYFEDLYEDHHSSGTLTRSPSNNRRTFKCTAFVCTIPVGMTFKRGCLLEKFIEALRAINYIFYTSRTYDRCPVQSPSFCQPLSSISEQRKKISGKQHEANLLRTLSSYDQSSTSELTPFNDYFKKLEPAFDLHKPSYFRTDSELDIHELQFQSASDDYHETEKASVDTGNVKVSKEIFAEEFLRTMEVNTTGKKFTSGPLSFDEQLEQDGTLNSRLVVTKKASCLEFFEHSQQNSPLNARNYNETTEASSNARADPGAEQRLTEDGLNKLCGNIDLLSSAEHTCLDWLSKKIILSPYLSSRMIDVKIKIFPSSFLGRLSIPEEMNLILFIPPPGCFLSHEEIGVCPCALVRADHSRLPSLREALDATEYFSRNRGKRPCSKLLPSNYNILHQSTEADVPQRCDTCYSFEEGQFIRQRDFPNLSETQKVKVTDWNAATPVDASRFSKKDFRTDHLRKGTSEKFSVRSRCSVAQLKNRRFYHHKYLQSTSSSINMKINKKHIGRLGFRNNKSTIYRTVKRIAANRKRLLDRSRVSCFKIHLFNDIPFVKTITRIVFFRAGQIQGRVAPKHPIFNFITDRFKRTRLHGQTSVVCSPLNMDKTINFETRVPAENFFILNKASKIDAHEDSKVRKNVHNSNGIPNGFTMPWSGETSDTINPLRRENLRDAASFSYHTSSVNSPPEIEVIDTHTASVTSKTGCTAFAESRSRTITYSLPPLVLSVPAVQRSLLSRSVKHELRRSSELLSSSADPSSDAVDYVLAWLTSRLRADSQNRPLSGRFINLDRHQTVDFLLSVFPSVLPTSGSSPCRLDRVDYSPISVTVLASSSCVCADYLIRNNGIDFIVSRKMSLDNGIRPNSKGAKIAKLKKFFDSGATTSDDTDTTVSNVAQRNSDSDVNKLRLYIMDNKDDGIDSDVRSSSGSGVEHTNGTFTELQNSDNKSGDVRVIASDVSSDVSIEKQPSDNVLIEHEYKSSVKLSKSIGCSERNGLWVMRETEISDSKIAFANFENAPDPLIESTKELNHLIASSKAELSKSTENYSVPEKSNLEFYFESAFKNSQPPRRKFLPMQNSNSDSPPYYTDNAIDNVCTTNGADFSSEILSSCKYLDGCGNFCGSNEEEMYFDDLGDDEDAAVLSDGSSDEELKCRQSPINNGLAQPYALHTIIEESCEESERDSRTTTPTNRGPTSKLEKYFSWDIVNNSKNMRPKRVKEGEDEDDDESTLYSDSLSEASGSLTGDNVEIEPSPLQSSCLEKYFTSGLVGSDVSRYPEDAEHDDTSISDFDEDDRCHKISRAALLSSIDVAPSLRKIKEDSPALKSECSELPDVNVSSHFDVDESVAGNHEQHNDDTLPCDHQCSQEVVIEHSVNEEGTIALSSEHSTEDISPSDSVAFQSEIVQCSLPDGDCTLEMSEELSEMMKSSVSSSDPEMNYITAWQLLENELQQLMKNMSSTSQIDSNGNSSGSTYGSSHSDYGSDTVDAAETVDEDDNCAESKSKARSSQTSLSDPKQPNKRDSLDIVKKVLQCLNKEGNPGFQDLLPSNSDSESMLKDHVMSILKNITSGQGLMALMECENLSSIQAVLLCLDKVNASNDVSIKYSNLSNQQSDDVILHEVDAMTVDEGISVDSTENLASEFDTIPPCNISVQPGADEDTGNSDSSNSTAHQMHSPLNSVHNYGSYEVNYTVSDESVAQNIDTPPCSPSTITSDKGSPYKNSEDSSSQFSVYVDIEIHDQSTTVKERQRSNSVDVSAQEPPTNRSSVHLWVSDDGVKIADETGEQENMEVNQNAKSPKTNVQIANAKALSEPVLLENKDFYRSSPTVLEQEILNVEDDSDPSPVVEDFANRSFELVMCPKQDFNDSNSGSRGSSIKSTLSAAAMSRSVTNLSSEIDMGLKFSSLHQKPRTMVSMNPQHSVPESRHISSFLSPSTVFRKFKLPKSTGSPSSEISYPAKYLRKYGRSSSFECETMCGAASMPHLNLARGESYPVNGIGVDCDRDSSLIMDDDNDGKNSYFSCNHSALSLGAHSASTASVYSSAGGRYYCHVSGDVLFGLNYNQKSQAMEVFVKQCRNLTAVDLKKNRSDPYVKVYLLPDKSKSGKRKTKTKRNTLNPVFNELLRFPVLRHELESRTLWLSVWNSDLFGRNDFLGEIMLTLGQRLLDSPTLRWYPLQERAESLSAPLAYKGELFLALRYVPKDLSLEPRFRPAPVISLKGALHVLVKEARNIGAGKHSGSFDTFCKSYLLPDKSKTSKQKTPIVKRSQHPKWYYTMVYEDLSVEELKERSLELTLWDHDRITSNEFIGGVRLNIGTGLYHGVPVEWMDSSRDEASLWQAMLERPNMWVDGSLPLRPTLQSMRS